MDDRYFRPAETDSLIGDATKARKRLNWEPTISVKEMCAEMIAEDLARAKNIVLTESHNSLLKK